MEIFHLLSARLPFLPALLALPLSLAVAAHATENGANVWAVGAESYASASAVPRARQTVLAEFDFGYHAGRFNDGNGQDSGAPLELTVVANASKLTHNWGFRLLGGEVTSSIGLPFARQRVRSKEQTLSKAGIGNANLAPVSILYHKGIHHWLYEVEVEPQGPVYRQSAPLNVGQHNWAMTLAAAYTLTPRQQAQTLSAHFAYTLNNPNHATHYHSGNEFFTQFGAQQRLLPHRQITVGVSGAYYRQTTDDTQFGAVVVKQNANGTLDRGNRGHFLMIGPQVTLPLGRAGGMLVKWNRETLVRNRFQGDSIWVNFALPLRTLHLPRM